LLLPSRPVTRHPRRPGSRSARRRLRRLVTPVNRAFASGFAASDQRRALGRFS